GDGGEGQGHDRHAAGGAGDQVRAGDEAVDRQVIVAAGRGKGERGEPADRDPLGVGEAHGTAAGDLNVAGAGQRAGDVRAGVAGADDHEGVAGGSGVVPGIQGNAAGGDGVAVGQVDAEG